MHTSISRSWFWYVAGPAFIAIMLALAPPGVEGAPKKPTPTKALVAKAPTPAKTPTVNGAKKKNTKSATGKKKKHKKRAKKSKNRKTSQASSRGSGSGGGGGSGLLSSIRRDESRLMADLNRLKKLLR